MEQAPNELGELVKNLQVKAVGRSASMGRLIREAISKLEGEPLVIAVTRATSLERSREAGSVPLASQASAAARFLQASGRRLEVRSPASVTTVGRQS
jgi:hypothetical protein